MAKEIQVKANESLINNNIISLSHMASDVAYPVESEVYGIFLSKQSAALESLRAELLENETPLNELSDEMQEYEKYIVSMLKSDNIRVFDPSLAAEGDEVQTEWQNGEISLAEYLRDAIAKGYIAVNTITSETDEYSDTKEVYDALVAFIMDELLRDNQFSKTLYKYLVKADTITGYHICMVLFEQGRLDD